MCFQFGGSVRTGQHCLALSLIQGRKSGAVNLVDRHPYNARISCQVALKGQNA
jgi:hypothetical protein